MKFAVKLWIFVKRGFAINFSYKVYAVLGILGMLIGVLRFGFMAQFLQNGNSFPALSAYGGNLMAYFITGGAYMGYVSVAMNSFQSAIRSEQSMGTLEYLLMSDTPLWQILAFSGITGFLWTTLNIGTIFAFLALVFDVQMKINVELSLFVLVLSIVCIGGIGLISAGIIMVTKKGDPVSWIFTTLSGLVSGVFFPVSVLPGWIRWTSYVMPTTYAIRALRKALLVNATLADVKTSVLILLLISLITVPVGLATFKWGFDKAREKGSLVEY